MKTEDLEMAIARGERCENGHLVCTACAGCVESTETRVTTDRKGRRLCTGCREVWSR